MCQKLHLSVDLTFGIYINKMSFAQKLNHYSRRKSIRYGVPFLIFMIGGSFGLKEFTQIRYQFSKKQPVSPEDMKKYGVTMKKSEEVTLDSEYEKIKNLNIDNWENKRGPRPWEEEGVSSAPVST